jgi:hypothetical protein
MVEPTFPIYPVTPESAFDSSDLSIDWRFLGVRLFIRGLAIGFVILLLFTLALDLTGGRLIWLFHGGWD